MRPEFSVNLDQKKENIYLNCLSRVPGRTSGRTYGQQLDASSRTEVSWDALEDAFSLLYGVQIGTRTVQN